MTLSAALKTKRGNKGAFEAGSAEWLSSDPDVVSVTENPDNELEAIVEGLDGSSNESVVITFRADADQSEGIKEIIGTMSVVCTQGEATVIELTGGEPYSDEPETEPETEPVDEPETETGGDAPIESPVDSGDPDAV